MPNSLLQISTAILMAGALVAGAAQQPFWVVVVIAALATAANVLNPEAQANRAAQGKTLGQALPMVVLNQLIWVNLVYLVGYGPAYLLGGPLLPLPAWLSVAISAAGLAGVAVAARQR
ncbi:hypothetical protein SAMN05444722_2073 [Rhodovulum sp. ES.010]|uniref:hypothetical protein n=1 Tax=Rhodovulum sp. ES.010 TaxID=1882821 RepID=UPI0009263586|nr:hypothetical protein [Rhodovulum sp. ES.010]SIO42683.1 hypothetical protein SAMN05444722_2073 [Rhodovulum sp. ES.010]